MRRVTRRSVLAATVASGIGAVAGCLGDDETPASATDWLPADPLLETSTVDISYHDLALLREWPWSEAESLATDIASEFSQIVSDGTLDVSLWVTIPTPDDIVDHQIYQGSFDPDAIDGVGDDEYAGYRMGEIHDVDIAVDESTMVLSPAVEQFVDVANGDGETVADADDVWADGLIRASGAGIVHLGKFDDAELSVWAARADGEQFVAILVEDYPDAAAAETAKDELEEGQPDDDIEWTVSRDGDVLEAEVRSAEFVH